MWAPHGLDTRRGKMCVHTHEGVATGWLIKFGE